MQITYDSFHGLKRHFVGGLSEPSRFWLARAEGVHVGFSGEGVTESSGGTILDFGPVPVLAEHRRSVEIENRGQEPVQLTLSNPNPWLRAYFPRQPETPRLAGGEAAALEVSYRSDDAHERDWSGGLVVTALGDGGDEARFELGIRLTTVLAGAFGSYLFDGSDTARPHDFGPIDPEATGELPPYVVALDSRGSERLRVILEDLPAWLAAEVDGYPRYGPAPGRFFDRRAPLRLELRPVRHRSFLGPQRAAVILRTDDARQDRRRTVLELTARFERERPFVTAGAAGPLVLVRPESTPFTILLANWGRTPARLEVESATAGLAVNSLPELPGASGAEPGRGVVEATVAGEALAPEVRSVQLKLSVVDGDPDLLSISVPVAALEIEPGLLDFSTVRPGESRAATVRARSSDGRPLHLSVRILPEAQGVLEAKAVGDLVEVVCRPPAGAGPLRFQAPALEVSEPSLGLVHRIAMRLDVPAGFFSRLFGART